MIERKTSDASYNFLPFPLKLHCMLGDSEKLGFDHIVCWHPEGKSFKVLLPKRFQNEIMKDYFNQTKFKSFQRQLNIYGFKRIQTGFKKGGYIHKLFTRDAPELSEHMSRKSPSSTNRTCPLRAVEKILNFDLEPTTLFNRVPTLSAAPRQDTPSNSNGFEITDSEMKSLYDIFFPEDPSEKEMISTLFQDDCANFVPSISSFFSSMSTHHRRWDSLCSLSSLEEEDDDSIEESVPVLKEISSVRSDRIAMESMSVADEEFDKIEPQIQERSFPWKLHLLLENAKKEQYQHIISWIGDGTSFKVHDVKAFVNKIMPNYFDQTKYESFRRQLNLYGFSRISKGADRGIISHPNFIEGCPWLCNDVSKN